MRKYTEQKFSSKRHHIATSYDVYELARGLLLPARECLLGIYLNTDFEVLHLEIITHAEAEINNLHLRYIFKPAFVYDAAAFIVAHSYPTGVVMHTERDKEFTKVIIAAGRILRIPLIDHVIIGSQIFASVEVEY